MNAIESHQAFDDGVGTYYICSLHFEPNDLIIRGKRKTVIKGKAPSIFSHQDTTESCVQNEPSVNGNEICDTDDNNNNTTFDLCSDFNFEANGFEFDEQPVELVANFR